MKKIFFAFTLIIFTTHLSAQQTVNISTSPKTVPSAKKWVLKIDDEVLIDLSDLSFRDGNLCNAQLRSNPRSLVQREIDEKKKTQGSYNEKGDKGTLTETIDDRPLMKESAGKAANSEVYYSLNLAGWNFSSRPDINDRVSTKDGRMIFKITIDDSGCVAQAIPLEYNTSNDVLPYYRQVVKQIIFKKQEGDTTDISAGKITYIVRVE